MAKVATLEVEGLGAGLRYADVKRVFETQSNFSEQSEVAKRIKAALESGVRHSGRIEDVQKSFVYTIIHYYDLPLAKE